ncbi:MAG: class I SAM-dependent methyltransferase [Isosphaeraceae bacterium]|nr:class I SAM-dependent methyltransferase [Isosphaeraceae bacterium]
MTKEAEGQRRLIVDQFTRQAVPFRQMPAHSDRDAFRLVLSACQLKPDDLVLDVACGPGLTACAFAEVAAHVTGIDLTPAMIDEARSLQWEKSLGNVAWHVGDVTALPFPDAAFSVVFTRYSFHHLLDPGTVLAEMVRVAKPGGRVVVVDVYTSSPQQAELYNQVEKLRDPSHVRALALDELRSLFESAGLTGASTDFYNLDVSLEQLLGSSFPSAGDADKVRQIFAHDIGTDRLGVSARRVDGEIHFVFPIVILAGRKTSGTAVRTAGSDHH